MANCDQEASYILRKKRLLENEYQDSWPIVKL